MTRAQKRRSIDALHEAAHAVFAVKLGARVARVTIDADEAVRILKRSSDHKKLATSASWGGMTSVWWTPNKTSPRKLVAQCLAGCIAQAKLPRFKNRSAKYRAYTNAVLASAGDWKDAFHYTRLTGLRGEAANAYITDCLEAAYIMAKLWRRPIRAVQKALLKHTTLTGKQFHRVVKEAA